MSVVCARTCRARIAVCVCAREQVDEYKIAQLYMTAKSTRLEAQRSDGAGKSVESSLVSLVK